MLMNSIILTIGGCDTLRPLGTFANNACDIDAVNNVESSFNSPKSICQELCLQNFPRSVSFRCMHGVSVEV
jgi:hypothetical protein